MMPPRCVALELDVCNTEGEDIAQYDMDLLKRLIMRRARWGCLLNRPGQRLAGMHAREECAVVLGGQAVLLAGADDGLEGKENDRQRRRSGGTRRLPSSSFQRLVVVGGVTAGSGSSCEDEARAAAWEGLLFRREIVGHAHVRPWSRRRKSITGLLLIVKIGHPDTFADV